MPLEYLKFLKEAHKNIGYKSLAHNEDALLLSYMY